MKLLVIDNYDSFTYNLVQYLGELGAELEVVRHDVLSAREAFARRPAGIVVSPGPGDPSRAGISCDLVRLASGTIPILGVCLGHQCLAAVFGGRVVRAERIMHGKTSPILHDGRGIFAGLENPFVATRYHSLLVERESLPPCSRGAGANGRGRDHGAQASRARDLGRSVPPRVDSDPGGEGSPPELPRPVRERGMNGDASEERSAA